MNREQFNNSLGFSNSKRFSPQGQKNLPKSDISTDLRLEVRGESQSRPTAIYLKNPTPERVADCIARYVGMGLYLIGPGVNSLPDLIAHRLRQQQAGTRATTGSCLLLPGLGRGTKPVGYPRLRHHYLA